MSSLLGLLCTVARSLSPCPELPLQLLLHTQCFLAYLPLLLSFPLLGCSFFPSLTHLQIPSPPWSQGTIPSFLFYFPGTVTISCLIIHPCVQCLALLVGIRNIGPGVDPASGPSLSCLGVSVSCSDYPTLLGPVPAASLKAWRQLQMTGGN